LLQTRMPMHFLNPNKDALVADLVGKPFNALRTPAYIMDHVEFTENCRKMHTNARDWRATSRYERSSMNGIHFQRTRLQLVSDIGRTSAVVVSTLTEVLVVMHVNLFRLSPIFQILYGFPVGLNKLDDLSALHAEMARCGGTVHILLDHLDLEKFLEEYERAQELPKKWSMFIKMNGGLKQAGIIPEPVSFKAFMRRVFASLAISVFGFYTHTGYSYGLTSLEEATSQLTGEVCLAHDTAAMAIEVLAESDNREVSNQPFVLFVGSTPTALSVTAEAKLKITSTLNGTLEV
ncbi:hypothetical protein EDD22DRAFT_758979, partial [Suillus occidentalis]